MDADRFDSLARTLSKPASRRTVLGSALVAALGALRLDTTDAKKKKVTLCHSGQTISVPKKKKKAHLRQGDTVGPCPPLTTTPTPSCAADQKPCKGGCIPSNQCCEDGDCAGGRTCQLGTCACPPAKPHVCAGSTLCEECCGKADCASFPALSGPGVPECANHVCVCQDPATRLCPGVGVCGECCVHSECTGGRVCIRSAGELDLPYRCLCDTGTFACAAPDKTTCIPSETICKLECGTPCHPSLDPCACPHFVCQTNPVTNESLCVPR
jgi:hypothetical protein